MTSGKTAVITGITGQYGSYQAQLLLGKGYKVYGTYRRTSSVNFWRIEELDNLDVSRDFSDVRDIARAYFLLYESDAHSEIFNLSSGNVYTLNYLIETMNEIAGYKISVEVNPAFERKNEIKTLHVSNEKLRAQTDYMPEYTLVDTLENMYNHKS